MFKLDHIFIIAEMANAHEGDIEAAKKIIKSASDAQVDAVKFQIFTANELAVPSFPYYELYQKLQMTEGVWQELVDYAHSLKLQVYADVFGPVSAKLANELGIDGIKIHATDVSNRDLLRYVGGLNLPVLLSTAGSTWMETAEAVDVLNSVDVKSVVLMMGIQSYPTELSHSYLRRIEVVRSKFQLPVGFASHVNGGSDYATKLPIWAITAGADVVEVHITLDRSAEGLDYYSSLEPLQLTELVAEIRAMEVALGQRSFQLSSNELDYRFKHKKFLTTTRDIQAGETLGYEDLALKRVDNPSAQNLHRFDSAINHEVLKFLPAHSKIQRKDLKMKVVATLACRLESSRLYGKPMQLVGDKPIIQHLTDRIRRTRLVDDIVLAVSEGPGNNVFIQYAKEQDLPYIVGDEKDVLKRLILAADHMEADIVVRITTENPFIYWENIDFLISDHIEHNADLTVTEHLPLGAFVEVVSLEALKKSHKYGEDRHRGELCTLFIAENSDIFKILRISPVKKLRRPDIRLTVDTPQDLILVRMLWEKLHEPHSDHLVTIEQIVDFVDANPDVVNINSGENTLYLWR